MKEKLRNTGKWALDAPGLRGVLGIMHDEPGKPQTIDDMAQRLGLRPKTIELAITVLRRKGYNILNKRDVGFWLDPRPPRPALGGPGTKRWQGEPPTK